MKIKRNSLFLLIALIPVLLTSTIPANALNTGFDTYEKPAEEKASFISNINLSLITEEPAKKSIECFAVSDNHMIAVGQENLGMSRKKTVSVYSSDGVFQYGYTFGCYGAFGLEWDNENLNIYFVRSDVILSVTPSGEVLDALEIQDTKHSNAHMNDLLNSNKRKIGDTEYALQIDLGFLRFLATSHSKVIATNENGETSVIYDATEAHLLETSLFAIYLSFFLVAFIVYAIRYKIKQHSKKRR